MRTASGDVTIHTLGRCGSIEYREGVNVLQLDWEFSGGPEEVASIWLSSRRFDERYAWAAGRLREILQRVGAEVVRQKSPECTFEIDSTDPDVARIRLLFSRNQAE